MLSRRAPLKRTGFGRAAPAPRPPREERATPPAKPLAKPARYTVIGDSVTAAPKTLARRNPALLRMARDKPCLLMVPGVCNFDPSTTVACHSNWSEHGKGGARKADDCYVVGGCSACHQWLDAGPAPEAEKRLVFMLAMKRQVHSWTRISISPNATPSEVSAATWALHHLVADGFLTSDLRISFRFPVPEAISE